MPATDFTCEECARSFNRREHLERHRRMHSQERPFACAECGKSFARRDVYRRHLRTHSSSPLLERQSALTACDSCHRRKVKCHPSERPCPRCRSAGVTCSVRQRPTLGVDAPILPVEAPLSPLQGPGLSFQADANGDLSGLMLTPQLKTSLNNNTNSSRPAETRPPNGSLPFGDGLSSVVDGEQYHLDFLQTDPYSMLLDQMPSEPFPLAPTGFFQDFSFMDPTSPTNAGFSPWAQNSIMPAQAGSYADNMSLHHLSGTELAGEDRMSEWEVRQQRLAAAYSKLNEFSTTSLPSRPASPGSVQSHWQYLQDLGSNDPPAYDTVIINVFVGLFQVHVAPSFPCFKNFRIDASTAEEVYLSMAAVGGLYCQISKSDIVAKWLLHTARRKLLTAVHRNKSSNEPKVEALHTYILMEIFAFACGDRRMLLLLDVFHAQMVQDTDHPLIADQTFRAITREETDSRTPCADRQNLAHAVHLLECLRVVLLHRPAMLYPRSVLNQSSSTIPNQAAMGATLSLLLSFTSYETSGIKIDSAESSLESLCTLAIIGSHTRRLPPGSLAQQLQLKDGQKQSYSHGWRQEFLELALQRWLSSHLDRPRSDVLLLYHTVHLSLYTSFARLAQSAHAVLTRGQSTTDKDHTSGINDHERESSHQQRNFTGRQTPRTNNCFSSGEDQEKAVWHARRVLLVAEQVERDKEHDGPGRVHLLKKAQRITGAGAAHHSYAIYYATMVLWWSSSFDSPLHRHKQSDNEKPATAEQVLRRGIDLLSRSTSQVAVAFTHILASLESRR